MRGEFGGGLNIYFGAEFPTNIVSASFSLSLRPTPAPGKSSSSKALFVGCLGPLFRAKALHFSKIVLGTNSVGISPLFHHGTADELFISGISPSQGSGIVKKFFANTLTPKIQRNQL